MVGASAMQKELLLKPKTQVERELEKLAGTPVEEPEKEEGRPKGMPAVETDEERKARKREYMRKWLAKNRDKKKARPRELRALRNAQSPDKALKEKRAKKAAKLREYRAKLRAQGLNQKKRPYKRQGPTPGSGPVQAAMAVHTNGHLPVPFKFCVACGEKLPTREFRGRELPAAFAFCGHCGMKLPTMGGGK